MKLLKIALDIIISSYTELLRNEDLGQSCIVFPADILMCHNRTNTDVVNDINSVSDLLKCSSELRKEHY